MAPTRHENPNGRAAGCVLARATCSDPPASGVSEATSVVAAAPACWSWGLPAWSPRGGRMRSHCRLRKKNTHRTARPTGCRSAARASPRTWPSHSTGASRRFPAWPRASPLSSTGLGPSVCSVRAQGDRGHGGADAISSTSLDIVLAAIAAAAAAVAVWRSILAGQQAREAKKARELSAVISLFNAHQSEDHSHIRRLIRHGTIADHLDDQETRVQLRHYINQLNFIATLRARHLLDDELVKDLFYEPARTCWSSAPRRSSARSVRPRTTTSPGSYRNGSGRPIL